MFTKKENFKKLLDVIELNFEHLDENTLIDWEIASFTNNPMDDLEDSWVYIEVWKDENNAIKILEQTDFGTEEITEKLPKEIVNHIYGLVYKEILNNCWQEINYYVIINIYQMRGIDTNEKHTN